MARLVDCYPSSNDELPQLDELVKRPSTGSVRLSKNAMPKSPDKKALVPKSSSVSSTRKVRRLAAVNQASANPLFLPWNADDGDSSQDHYRVSPGKSDKSYRRQDDRAQHHVFKCKESSPRPSSIKLRARRHKSLALLQDDSDDDAVGASIILEDKRRRLRGGLAGAMPDVQVLSMADDDDLGGNGSRDDIRLRKPNTAKGMVLENELKDTRTGVESDESSVYQTAAEDSSVYGDGSTSEFELDDVSDESIEETSVKRLFGGSREGQGTRSRTARKGARQVLQPRNANIKSREPTHDLSEDITSSNTRVRSGQPATGEVLHNPKAPSAASNLTNAFEKLRIHIDVLSDDGTRPGEGADFATPPTTPPRESHPRKLVSPQKLARIPQTPHRPSVDAFWSQDFVDDWNDQHSPRKLMLPVVTKSPTKACPKKATRKSFEAKKHSLAEEFLRELDAEITQGKIAELAESTGGVKLVWTKTLKTTAGRANWRRETTRTQQADGSLVSVNHKHHASIELAEKVIDDENRLLNVLAHEFCHLANFMISGVKNNPHGKEFKAWASKCSRAFGESRGIQVTTKHTYDIDFKYVWECTACGSEYKRHSKSIDEKRHRCGSCKSVLKQIKPVPRGSGAGAGAGGKPSEYQMFVKEQMGIVRGENPGMAQKEVMRTVADKWKTKKMALASEKESRDETGDVVAQMVDLTLAGSDETD